MNKKADAEGLEITFSIIFLTLILIVFWILSFANRGVIREETSYQIEVNSINIDLMNLLRTEVDNAQISDLIAKSYYDKDYTKLKEKVNSIFTDYFDKNYCWTLFILEENIIIESVNNNCGGAQISSEMKIPTFNSKDLTIKLSRYGSKQSKPDYARDKS